MNKIISLSLVAATLLFTGCGEDTKKDAAEATTKAVEVTKDAANTAVEAAKEATAKAVEATKEAAKATKEAAEKAANKAEEAVSKASAEVVNGAIGSLGKDAYAKCAGCHGVDGKTKALGKSPVIAGLDKAALLQMLKDYKAGTRNETGMGALMKGQVSSMDDATLVELATYISTLK